MSKTLKIILKIIQYAIGAAIGCGGYEAFSNL